MSAKTVLKGLAAFGKDLLVLVLGIYLALAMGNTVQDWENEDREADYLYRLSLDLKADAQRIRSLLSLQEAKLAGLGAGLERMQQSPLNLQLEADQQEVLVLAQLVGNYYFFTPQDFTFLSMRESGDFKLLQDDALKGALLKIHGRYQQLAELQANYMQGLDTEFMPLWVRSVDLLDNRIYDRAPLESPLFKNLVVFALNETNNRYEFLQAALTLVDQTEQGLLAASARE